MKQSRIGVVGAGWMCKAHSAAEEFGFRRWSGKHIYCEKPLALTAAGARAMTGAAEAAGVTTIVGFAYLKNPVQQFARQLIASAEISEIIQFRGAFDQDALVDPAVPFSWRFEKAVAGSGRSETCWRP